MLEPPPLTPGKLWIPRPRVGICALMFMVFVIGTIASAAGVKIRQKNEEARDNRENRCKQNLGRLSLALIQYSDDWKRFPHLSNDLDVLDHDGRTLPSGNDVPPRIVRALFAKGYLDDPTVVVCPSSSDAPKHDSRAIQNGPRVFGWDGTVESTDPLLVCGKKDGDADALTDLSYGITIKGYRATDNGSALLAADRARTGVPSSPQSKQPIAGNHPFGWYVAHLDGHVSYVPASSPRSTRLSSTEVGGGYLVVWDDAINGLEPVR